MSNTQNTNQNDDLDLDFADLDFSIAQSENRVSEKEAAKIACSIANPGSCEECQS